MRITKQLAEDLAKMLTAKKDAAITKAEKEMIEFLKKIYLKSVPSDIIAAFNKHKSFINTTSYLYLYGVGFNSDCVNICGDIPCSDTQRFVVPDKDAPRLKSLISRFKYLKEEKRGLRLKTEAALLTLSTSKRVIEQFPELESYLTALSGGKLVPVPNIEQLKKELKS